MDFINRIELRGRVGSISIRKAGETRCARVKLATDYYYKGRDGGAVVDTTWHNLVIWDSRTGARIDEIKSGDCLHIYGRLRTDKYTTDEGEEKYSTEIVVAKAALEEEDLVPRRDF